MAKVKKAAPEESEKPVKRKQRKAQVLSTLNHNDVQDLLKADDKMVQYRRIVKGLRTSVDFEKINTELKNLHAGRASRTLYGKTPSVDTLVNASMQDSATRSRITEIRVEITRQRGMLVKATKAITGHILQEFRDHTAALRTKGERMGFAERYVERGKDLEASYDNLVERCDYLIKDIDQSGYSLRLDFDCLELIYSRANNKQNI